MFTYWAMVLSISGMYSMYITEIGFSKKEISISVTIFTISALIGQSFIGFLVDKYRCTKKIMLGSIAMGLLGAFALPYMKSNLSIYFLLCSWGFFIYGTVPLSEAWCIETLKTYGEQKNFGKVRGFGSIGYGLSGVLLGSLLQKLGWNIYPIYMIVGILCTLLIIFLMKDTHSSNKKEFEHKVNSSDNISLKEALKEIFKIKPLMVMIAIIFMYTFVIRGIYSYLAVLIADYGGGAASLGYTYFFDATPEVVTFFLAANLLKKFQGKNLIFIAFLLQIIRLTVILIFNNSMAVMLMGILSGFAFGLLASSYKTYIYELAPAKYKASCMSLSESIIGLSGIISVPIFGMIFTNFGTNSAILFGLCIYILSAAILMKDILSSRKNKGHRLKSVR
jgi:predicted MFS family arabinose efflux permease